jgi:opacity protein-like surface antigen
VSSSAGLRLQGGTNSGFLMLNGYYDFYTPSEDDLSPLIPYVGLGLGYAYVENNIQFYYDNTQLTVGNIVEKYTKPAGQVIIGTSYFLDDLTSFGLDFRYLTTASNTKTTEYNIFKTKEQIYTLNLTFNGAFDLG